VITLREEKSKSLTGKHAVRYIVFIVDEETRTIKTPKIRKREKVKPVYKRGEAYNITLQLPEKHLAVQVRLVKGLHSKINGEIEIYNR